MRTTDMLKYNIESIAHQITLLPAIERAISFQNYDMKEMIDVKIKEFLE